MEPLLRSETLRVEKLAGIVPVPVAAIIAGSACCSSHSMVSPSDLWPNSLVNWKTLAAHVAGIRMRRPRPSTLVWRSLVDRFTGVVVVVTVVVVVAVGTIDNCCCGFFFMESRRGADRVEAGWESDLVAMAREASRAVEVEVEDEEEEEGKGEEDEEVDAPAWAERPAWTEMEPIKGPPDLPSKGTTRWEDEDWFCCCWGW